MVNAFILKLAGNAFISVHVLTCICGAEENTELYIQGMRIISKNKKSLKVTSQQVDLYAGRLM